MAAIVYINNMISLILMYSLCSYIMISMKIFESLSFGHPQILVAFIVIFNMLKSFEYITSQLVFHYIPHLLQETILKTVISSLFIQQLLDTVLIKILWHSVNTNYIIHNVLLINIMDKFINFNYILAGIYSVYIIILWKK